MLFLRQAPAPHISPAASSRCSSVDAAVDYRAALSSICSCLSGVYGLSHLYTFGGVVKIYGVIPRCERLSGIEVDCVGLAFLQSRQASPMVPAFHTEATGDARSETLGPQYLANKMNLCEIARDLLCWQNDGSRCFVAHILYIILFRDEIRTFVVTDTSMLRQYFGSTSAVLRANNYLARLPPPPPMKVPYLERDS